MFPSTQLSLFFSLNLAAGAWGRAVPAQQHQLAAGGGEVVSWSWDTHPRQLGGVMGGLGMVAVPVSVTLQARPLALVQEVSYLTSVKEVVDTWHMVTGHRTSDHQQLTWFPFTELVIILILCILRQQSVRPHPTVWNVTASV